MKTPKEYEKMMSPVLCNCKGRSKAKREKQRLQYGVSHCDVYSMYYNVGNILANAIYLYLSGASQSIARGDWEALERAADMIKEFSNADFADTEFKKKEREFKKAMRLLAEKWRTLWW